MFFFAVGSVIPATAFAQSASDDPYRFSREPQNITPFLEPDTFTGAFTQSIPIIVPSGRNGMQPDLKLNYSSQSGQENSIFGYGWSLNGIPYIERLPKDGTDKLYNQDRAHTYFYSSLSGGELLPIGATTTASSFLSAALSMPFDALATMTDSGASTSALLFPATDTLLTTDTSTTSIAPETDTTSVTDQPSASDASTTTSASLSTTTVSDKLPIPLPEYRKAPLLAETSDDDIYQPDGLPKGGGKGGELVDARTATSKKFLSPMDKNGQSQVSYHLYAAPIHYADPTTGRMEDIDSRLVANSTGWQMTKAPYQAAFANDDAHHLTTFAHDGQELYVDLPAMVTSSLKAAHIEDRTNEWKDRQLVYPDALGAGIDLGMRTEDNKLVKEVILHNKPANLSGDFYDLTFTITANRPITLSSNGKTLTEKEPLTSSSTAIITDADGVRTYILPPVAQSAKGKNDLFAPVIPIDITYTQKGNVITFTKHVPASFLSGATYPVTTDATISINSGMGDGYAWADRESSQTTWSDVRDGGGTSGTAGNPFVRIGVAKPWWGFILYRGFLPFDTSALSDSYAVASSTLYLQPDGGDLATNDQYAYLKIIGPTSQATTTNIDGGDYQSCGSLNNPDIWSEKKLTYYDSTSTTYVAFPLNATGTANVSRTGWTMIGVRSGNDLESVPPSYPNNSYFHIKSMDGGTTTAPYLDIVMATSGTPFAPTVLQTEGVQYNPAVATTVPRFSAIFNSSLATDTAQYYQIQVTSSSTSWASPEWDSGKHTTSSSTQSGTRMPDVYYGSSTALKLDGTKHYWRIRTWNQADATSSWSTTGDYFIMLYGKGYGAKIENGDFLTYYERPDGGWTAYDKKGNTFIFGTSTLSRVDNGNSTTTFRWMLESITDPNGNSVRYEYFKDGGQLYPSKITYTNTATTSGIFDVTFLREPRADISTSSASAFDVVTKYRVNEIVTHVNGQIAQSYKLGYAPGDDGFRSLLKYLQVSGFDGAATTTLPRTIFGYSTSTNEWTYVTASTTQWTLPSPGHFFADAQGVDGAGMAFDSTGDGLPELLWNTSGTIDTSVNNGKTWNSGGTVSPLAFNGQTRGGDFNGDGRPDLMRAHRQEGSNPVTYNAVYLGTAGGSFTQETNCFQPPVPLTIMYPNQSAITDSGERIGDINDDHRDDLYGDQGSYINDGCNFVRNPAYDIPVAVTWNANDVGVRLTRADQDELNDVVVAHGDLGQVPGTAVHAVFRNTGHGFALAPTLNVPFTFIGPLGDQGERLDDLGGHGAADAYGDQGMYRNTPNGWVSASGTFPMQIVQTYPSARSKDLGALTLDIDGDGLPDAIKNRDAFDECTCAKSDKRVWLKNGTKADLLNSVSTDKGAVTTVTYQSSKKMNDGGTLLNPNLPLQLDLIQTIATNPGFGGTTSTDTYSYSGGEYYSANYADRKFAGFSSITKTNSAGNTVRTFYHQGNSTDSANGEYNDHIAKAGKPYQIDLLDGTSTSAKLYSRTFNTWVRADYGDGRSFIKRWKTVTQTFDGDSTHRDTAQEDVYDDTTGNLATSTFYGEVTGNSDGTFTDIGSDSATTTRSFAASSTNSVMSAPSRELVVDQSGATVRDTKWTYDGLSFGSVSKGNQTKEEKLKSGSSYASTTKTFNSYGLVTQSTDPRGGTTTYSYDTYNLFPATTTNALGQTQTFVYDYSSGKVATTTDANSRTFATDFDGLDRPIREKQPDFTTPTTLVLSADYTYIDSTSSPSSIYKRAYLTSGTSSDLYAYLDGLGRTIQTRREAEAANTFTVSDTIYNNIGQVGTSSLPYFSTGTAWTAPTTTNYLLTATTYDPAGRAQSITDTFGTTTSRYSDWFTRVIDPLGNYKDITKDAYGNLAAVGEELSSTSTATTTYTWNLNQKLTKLTDASANVRNFTYDNLGRSLVSEDLHASADTTFGTTTRTYDDAGNITQGINPRGQTINYVFDALNRPTSEDFTGQSGTEVQYFYDTCTNGKGRLCSVQKQNEATTTYAYNPIGLLTAEGKVIGLGSTQSTATTSFTAMRNGKDDTITYPDGALVSYIYDAAGLLDKVTNKESGGSAANVINRITWTPTEQIEAQDYANGVNSTSTYDQTKKYRLTNKFTKNSVVLQDIRYTYDAAGNITTLDEEASTSARKTVNYVYDPLYRLLSASTTAVATGTSGYLQPFAYDPLGNMLSGPSGSYTYGQTGYANPDAVTALAGSGYAYDQSGNLIQSGNSIYAWDYNNRMVTATVVTASTTVATTTTTITKDAVSTNGVFSVSSTTYSLTVSSTSTLLVVGASIYEPTDANRPITNVTYNGVALTKARADDNASTDGRSELWYLSSPASGTHNVTITLTGTVSGIDSYAASFGGVRTSSPLDTSGGSTTTNVTTHAIALTGGTAGELFVDALNGDSTPFTPDSAQTVLLDNSGSTGVGSYKVSTTSGTVSMTYRTSVNNNAAHSAAAFLPTISGGSTSTATPAYVQSKLNTVQGSSTNFVNFTNTVATGDLVVVALTVNSQTIASNAITDNKGNTYTKAAESIHTAFNNHVALFYAANVTGGANFRVTSNIGDNTLSAQEYSGVATSNPLDKVATSTGTSTTPSSGNVTTTLGNELSVGAAWSGGHLDAWTAGSGYTKREEQLDDNTYERQATEDKTVSAATTTDASFTTSSSANWAALIATFKPLVTTSTSTGTTTTYSTTTVTYLYDQNGDRVQMTDSTTTSYLGKLYQQTSGGYKKTKQLPVNGVLIATIEKIGSAAATPYYISSDNLGGASILTNASGTAIQTLDYTPFGDIRVNSKNTGFDEPRKYIGQLYDDSTNLNFLNARYLDSRRGQFTGQDPVARDIAIMPNMAGYILDVNQVAGTINQTSLLSDPQLLNSYSYAKNSPVTKSDPSGKLVGIDNAAGALVGAMAGVGIYSIQSIITGKGTAGGAAGAFVSGAITGFGAVNTSETAGASLAITRAAGLGGIGGFFGNLTQQKIDTLTGVQSGGVSFADAGTSAAFGAAFGGVTEGVLPSANINGITAGRDSMQAVFRGVQTRIANGSAQTMSALTALKGAVGTQVGGAYKTVVSGAADTVRNTVTSSPKQNACPAR